MISTLNLLHFSLGKGGTWGLEQFPQFTIIYSVPALDVLLNSIPDIKMSKTVPSSGKLKVRKGKLKNAINCIVKFKCWRVMRVFKYSIRGLVVMIDIYFYLKKFFLDLFILERNVVLEAE